MTTKTQALALHLQKNPLPAPYRLYQDSWDNSLRHAESELGGRTHYVDPNTMRAFKARILDARTLADGLLFGIVESATYGDGSPRFYRAVVFDLIGRVVEPSRDVQYGRPDYARKDLRRLEGLLDAVAITRDALAELRRRSGIEYDRATRTTWFIDEQE